MHACQKWHSARACPGVSGCEQPLKKHLQSLRQRRTHCRVCQHWTPRPQTLRHWPDARRNRSRATLSARVFVDSNIPMYVAGSEHANRAPALGFLNAVRRGEYQAFTSTEVLQEVLYQYSALKRSSFPKGSRAVTVLRMCSGRGSRRGRGGVLFRGGRRGRPHLVVQCL
jgi:hypothetical protein